MNGKPSILVLGANPAWQHVFIFARLITGQINRAQESLYFPSGKGINFCRAARIHGRAETRLFQFLGGQTGRLLADGLDRENYPHTDIQTVGSSRSCLTCRDLETGEITELIGPSGAAGEVQVDAMLNAIREAMPSGRLLALCGTLPPGTPNRLYREAAELARSAGRPLLVDSFDAADSILNCAAEQTILKINRDELAGLTGETEIMPALRKLTRDFPLRAAAITDGPNHACLWTEGALWFYTVPRLEKVVNPIGSGDTASAVLAGELLTGTPLPQAFARALGAATANCLSPACGEYDPERAAEFTAGIRITEATPAEVGRRRSEPEIRL